MVEDQGKFLTEVSPKPIGLSPSHGLVLVLSSSTIDKKLENFEFIFKLKTAINFKLNFEIFFGNFELNFVFFVNDR